MTYTLKNQENYENMGLQVFLYEHDKTKARVVYVKSDDKNKTFAIGFKTPPTNSKGMAHIMEHSVLNGSDKYNTREPFMDMASSSLQTFLNAMTFPDKTVYPVSSENDKDFYNLTDVYLDAVFNPTIRHKKEILLQEGWHYVLDGDKVSGISGVVYNEMKGALSDPDQLIYDDVVSHLYKNSPYEYESGGDPSEIYKLTYDEFLDFYKDHYHPSNSYIYFYGDLDIDFYLEHLDKNYLSKYDYEDIDYDIKVSDNHYDNIVEGEYPVSKVEEDSDYLIYSFLGKENPNGLYSLSLQILISALFNMDSSKIKKQINEEINPESFSARLSYGVRNGVILQAQKADGNKIDRYVEIIEEGLKQAAESINKESLKAAFSIFEYGQRDQLNSVTRGLVYYLMWNFDKEIFEVFNIVSYLDELRSLIDTDYYENFIKENFLDNPTKLVYIARASSTFKEKKDGEFDSYLEKLNANLTKEELDLIKEDVNKLHIHQNTEDTEEQKARIPVLNIEDVPAKIDKTPREVIEDKFTYIFHDLETAGLIYTSLYFNVNHLSLDELKYLGLINDLLGSVDTGSISYQEIDDVLFQNLSMPNFSNTIIAINDTKVDRLEKVSFMTTASTQEKAFDLMADFMFNSKFDKKKRILEILRMKKAYFESTMYDQGHLIAMNRANAHIDMASMIRDQISGIGSYLFVKEAIKEANEDFDSFSKKITDIYKKIFSGFLEVNITSSLEDFKAMKDTINGKLDKLEDKPNDGKIDFTPQAYKEALLSDANVNYVSKTANIKDFDYKYDGKLALATSILSNPYLYELIRAKGGAYGAGITANNSGLLSTYSYRDPNILLTVENFDKIGELTKDIDLSPRDFENQQIASMGAILRPKSPSALGDEDYIRYKKEEPINPEKILKDIKESTLSDVKAFDNLFDRAMENNNLCAFGNRKDILEVKEEFDKIIDLND